MLKEIKDINYYSNQYLDFLIPTQESFYTILFIHGGGLVEGDKSENYEFVKHLVKLGYAVSTINYSFLKDAKHQTILKQAAKAVKYTIENINKYGQSKGLIIMGQSAGAWIALMLCLNKKYFNNLKIDESIIKGYVSDSGQPTTHYHILEYERGLNPLVQRIDKAAPLFYVDKCSSFPPLLLTVYNDDLPNRLEQNKLFISAINNINPNLDVSLKILDGGHCHGSCELAADGEYELIKVFQNWASKKVIIKLKNS